VPPKPAQVAWGEEVTGLQIGLQVIGGEEEMRLRSMADLSRTLASLTGQEHGIPVDRALHQIADQYDSGYVWRAAQRLAMFAQGGHTFTEALKRSRLITEADLLDAVRVGETAGELPAAIAQLAGSLDGKAQSRGTFAEREDIFTIVSIRNTSERALTLADSVWPYRVHLTIECQDGSPPIRYRDPTLGSKSWALRPLMLPAGGERAVTLVVQASNPKGFSQERPPNGRSVSPAVFLAGRWTLTATYEPDDLKSAVPCWLGRISSGQVAIEITPKAAPAVSEARAREVAIATVKKRYPTYADEILQKDWKVRLLADGKHWEAVWSWDNGIRGHKAELRIDAVTGEVKQFRDLPGD